MDFIFRRTYRGQLKAVILDWAGTTVDFGSFAPTSVFPRLFESRGVTISVEQARLPMGLMKKDHLRAIFAIPEVSRAWQHVHGVPYMEQDVEEMFQAFVPMQKACLAEYADPIPGTLDTIDEMNIRGLKVGTTTGYTREMMEVLLPEAKKRGYSPDICVCPTDVPAGRPFPWMCFQNAIQMQVSPMQAMVKIGDTLPDIEEGLNAGMWTIGIALTGNLLGLTETEYDSLSKETIQAHRETISAKLFQAGAHYVVDGIWDVPGVLDDIDGCLRLGLRP